MDLKTLHAQYEAECEDTPPWDSSKSFEKWLAERLEAAEAKVDDLLHAAEQENERLRNVVTRCIDIAKVEGDCWQGKRVQAKFTADMIVAAMRREFLTSPRQTRPSLPPPTSSPD